MLRFTVFQIRCFADFGADGKVSISSSSLMLKSIVRFLIPSGLLEILKAQRVFAKIHIKDANSWRAACSPSLRNLLESSRIGFVPEAILRQPKLIVDVGANVGAWSEAIIKIVAPQHVIAVEPFSNSFAQMKARLSKYPEVKLVQCAIGAQTGKTKLHSMEDSQWNSLLPVREEVKGHYPTLKGVKERAIVEVDVIRLDDLLQDVQEIDLLKIDVQGGEWAVMDGAIETLKRTKAVFLEVNFVSHYEGDRLFFELDQRMRDQFGFQLHCLANPSHNLNGKMLYADAVYVKPAFG